MIDVEYCVVGAGFAGLTVALRLTQAGHSVALLEARERVGGRTFTERLGDRAWIDRGGGWVGPGQDRIHALMSEFGVRTYKQPTAGANLMVVNGKVRRYQGTVPLNLNPWATANLGAAFLKLERLCRSIPLDEPWNAPRAKAHDATTLATWLRRNVHSKVAHELLETAVAGCYTSAASEVSMLFVLFQMASGGGPGFVLGVENRSQDSRPIGGMGAIYRPLADQLGDRIHLDQRVRSIAQDDAGVTVHAQSVTVRANRVIVAVPIAIAGHIRYEPQLPVDRAMLHQRMPSGRIHWAGTESSSVMCGWVDGAVRSGERAAQEVLNLDSSSAISVVADGSGLARP